MVWFEDGYAFAEGGRTAEVWRVCWVREVRIELRSWGKLSVRVESGRTKEVTPGMMVMTGARAWELTVRPRTVSAWDEVMKRKVCRGMGLSRYASSIRMFTY